MTRRKFIIVLFALALALPVFSAAASWAAVPAGAVAIDNLTPSQEDGTYYGVLFPKPENPAEGELAMDAEWRIWIPDGVEKLRGVVVHQHGCTMWESGRFAVYDLHWQELARRHGCALISPSFFHINMECVCWCDPRYGSANSFLAALEYFAEASGHAELTSVPWAIWGHSGGAQWASCMVQLYPERIVGAFLRSGHPHTKGPLWGELPMSDAVSTVPVLLNLGAKEYTLKIIWDEAWPYFQAMRSRGAKIGLIIDPRSQHETGDTRYPAIRFLDLCLSARLAEEPPADSAQPPVLRDMPGVILPESEITDQELSVAVTPADADQWNYYSAAQRRAFIRDGLWFPSADFIDLWRSYSVDNSFDDPTPPPAPTDLKLSASEQGGAKLTWRCRADIESGLKTFRIWRQKEGSDTWELAAELPTAESVGCRSLFQGCGYGDTPADPVPVMSCDLGELDKQPKAKYTVSAVNTAGLESQESQPVP